ncbi:MAG: hypothetical protein AAFO02_09180 [Bacteroidota bacterium]
MRPKTWEHNGKVYERLGVQGFVRFTPHVLWRKITGQPAKPFINRRNLRSYFRSTVAGELAHVGSLMIMLIGSLLLYSKGYLIESLLLGGMNILVNLYPIFLMRYNRFRIAGVLGQSIQELLS